MIFLSSSVLLLLSLFPVTRGETVDYSYGHFERLRLDATNNNVQVERKGNLDIVKDLEGKELASMCHIASYLGFSTVNGGCDQKQASKIYKELAAMLLAIHHFNNGNGVVVKEIDGINQRCSIRFSSEFHDSQYTPKTVVKGITHVVTQNAVKPCAIVGARTSSSTEPSSIISSVFDLPQMSFTATSPDLNDRFKFNLFSRVVPADDAAAKAALRFFADVAGSTNVAVLYINDPFGNEYNKAFLKESANAGINVQSFPLAYPPDPYDIQKQLERVKATGIRHVFMIVFSSYLEDVLTEAARQGIVGDDYFWLLGISTTFFENLDIEEGSDLARAVEGMGILPEVRFERTNFAYSKI